MVRKGHGYVQYDILKQMVEDDSRILVINKGGSKPTFGYVGHNQVDLVSIEALNNLGWIKKDPNPDWDWRGSQFHLTDEGRVAFEEMEIPPTPRGRSRN